MLGNPDFGTNMLEGAGYSPPLWTTPLEAFTTVMPILQRRKLSAGEVTCLTGLVTKAAGSRPPGVPDSDPFLTSRLILRRWVKMHISELLPGLDSLECGPPGKVEEEGPPSCLSSNGPLPLGLRTCPARQLGLWPLSSPIPGTSTRSPRAPLADLGLSLASARAPGLLLEPGQALPHRQSGTPALRRAEN